MARDVELVIRAKDAATKAIDSIRDALKDLTGVQESVGQSAIKTDTLLGSLGKQLTALNAEAKGLSALGKVAGEIDKAGASVARLEGDVRKSAAEFGKLARESEAAARSANQLRGTLDAERQALRESTAARKEAQAQLRNSNKEVLQAEAAQVALNKALERGTAAKPSNKAIGRDIGQPQTSAKDSAGVFIDAALTSARNNQAQLKQVVAEFTAEIAKSKQNVAAFEVQVGAAAEQERRLSRETEKASASLAKGKDDLTKSRVVLAEVTTAAGAASASLGNLGLNQDKISQASARMAAEVARAKAQIDALNTAQPVASVTGDRRAVLESRRDFVAAQAEVKRLADEMRSSQAPAAELGAALGRAQAAARKAAEAYDANRAAASRLKNEQSSLSSFLSRTASDQQKAANSFVQAQAAIARGGSQIASGATSAARALPPIAAAANTVDESLKRAATGGGTFREALTSIYGEGRQSLSLLQRMRGELLALAASYIGLMGAANQIGGILKSFQTLEAAQSRLGVAFGGDTGKVSKELEFISAQAQRLGVSFGDLSEQYGKFAVAANAANFTSEATRRVFLSVAEAGRVNKLSATELNGVFLALTQMISKGKIQAEELRGQLGERLTGAFNIFATAIGVSTAELDKMLEQGQVIASQGTLLKFADELDNRFGKQLQAALRGTTAEMGRFSDNVFQAQLRIAQGGFIDGFTKALANVNDYFQSREGRDFFLSLGSAIGKAAEALSNVPKYFSAITTGVSVLIGLKLGSYFSGIVTSLAATTSSITAANAGMFTWAGTVQAFNARLATFTTSMTAAGVSIGTFSSRVSGAAAGMTILQTSMVGLQALAGAAAGAFRLLWAAIGGVPGLIMTGVTIALGTWVTKVGDATTALDEHKRQMDAVIAKYDQAKGKVTDWSNGIKGVTASQAQDNLSKLLDAYNAKFEELNSKSINVRTSLRLLSSLPASQRRGLDVSFLGDMEKLVGVLDDLGKKRVSIEDFKKTLDAIAQTTKNAGLKNLAIDLQNSVSAADGKGQSFADLAEAIEQTSARLRLLKGDATEADKSLLGLKTAAATTFDKQILEDSKLFSDTLNKIKENIPGISEELKRLGEIDALTKQYNQAVQLARTMGQINELTQQYNAAVNSVNVKSFGGTGQESSINMIKQFEGFRATPYWDTNAYRVGYGSDTITLSDGTIQKVTQGIAIAEADALRDLIRRIGEFQDVVKAQIGADRFGQFKPDQQGVLTSIAYNYGKLPGDIVAAIKTGSTGDIAAAIRARGDDNNGINRSRRNTEAATFEGAGTNLAAEVKRAETAKEYNKDLVERQALKRDEIANEGKLSKEATIRKALADEQKKAEAAGVVLTAQQIEQVKTLAAQEYDLANAKTIGKTATQEANVALQQATALAAQRVELQKQFNLAQKGGDQTAAATVALQLESTNAQLQTAIDKARAMWLAIGGPEADVAITKLDTLKLKADASTNSLNFLGLSTKQVGDLAGKFADGLAGVFDDFAKAIANGENAVRALGKAFLQFAANFLKEIAQMIIKQQLLNAVQAFSKAFGFGFSVPGVSAHTGGVVGSVGAGMGNMRRTMAPALLAGAMAYHTGGVAGLRPDEVPAVLKQGEEVLTENDARHRNNGGLAPSSGGSSGPQAIRNILVMDEESALNHLNSASGEQVIMGHIKKNQSTIKQMLR